MKIHFIAIGGSAMHNLAIALHKKGYQVTGSDDEIVEPSKSRLASYQLLPAQEGWNESAITPDLDAVILGMHARADNPELLKAKALGLPIFSYPEYLYEQSKDKLRVVIGGSHGKTSITAMILHVLNAHRFPIDYMVGAQLRGFDTMVKITSEAKTIILEGDEYLSSPIDRRPKFHLYKGHVAVLSGIAWDHINVFPTFENYLDQFRQFIDTLEPNAVLIYAASDAVLKELVEKHERNDIRKIPYLAHEANTKDGITYLITPESLVPLSIFGAHNLQNLNAAKLVCTELGISAADFYQHIQTFKGASKRLELIAQNETCNAYKDFAHSPSKLMATTAAVKNQFENRKLIACMELHTFSSLTAEFLKEYHGCMNTADEAIVYFNPHTIEHKKLAPISIAQVKDAFAREDLVVFTESAKLQAYLQSKTWENCNLLLMSSGNFDGIKMESFAEDLLQR
ncbi:MAG: peptidoglycan synthetase [Pedobacter sp.]|nr:peptidoglycan synthetase [Pedobacter sp.]